MSEKEDRLVEALKRRKKEAEHARAVQLERERAERQALADQEAAFRELTAIPRARLEAAAQQAEVKLAVDDRRTGVTFRLGELISFRMSNLGQATASLPQGEVLGAAFFGSTENLLNSCNFVRIRPGGEPAARWQAWRFRISGGVAGDRVRDRLGVPVAPKFEDQFGFEDIRNLYEHGGKAGRGMHVVVLDVSDDIQGRLDEVINKEVG